jgi:hypothetical protein
VLVAERRLGATGVRALAASPSIRDALTILAHTPYRRAVVHDLDLVGAQRAVVAKVLLDLRLLAGWLPGDAAGLLRTLAAWFELANLEDRIAYFGGAPFRSPFELGSLAVVWPHAAGTQSLGELRRVIASSGWGDPGGDTPAQIGLGLRLAWARRVAALVPEIREWAAGASALLLARELFVVGLPVELLPLPTFTLLGSSWRSAQTFDRFAAELPPDGAWALEGIAGPESLWRAEAAWWARCETDARWLIRETIGDRRVVVGAAALLAADAHRVAAALAAVARRQLRGVEQVLDAIA